MPRGSVTTDDDFVEDDDLELTDDESVEDDEDIEDDEDDGDEGGTEAEGSQFDWESDKNPYKKRLQGIQGSLQQSQERLTHAEQRIMHAEAQAFKASIAHLEPAEQDLRAKQWLLQKAVEYQSNHNATQQEALNEVARSMLIQQVAQEFGVPAEKLARFKDPDDMRAYAEDLSKVQKTAKQTTRKEVRKVRKQDKFDSGGGRVGKAPEKKAKNLDDAAAMFAKIKIDF